MTTEEKKLCENCAPKPRTSISVTDIYHPHCAHCGRCLDGRCVQLKHDGTVLTPPETGREWEKDFDESFEYVGIALDWYTSHMYPKTHKSGEQHLMDIKSFIRSIESSALAQGEKIGAEKERERMLKIQSKRVGASIKKNPKRHSLHSLLTYYKKKKNGFMVKVIQEKLNALKGTL